MKRYHSRQALKILTLSGLALAISLSGGGAIPAKPLQAQNREGMSEQQVQAVLQQYCMNCHSTRSTVTRFSLEGRDLRLLDNDVVAWEAVVRKLRTGMMPPKGLPRPDRATLDAVAGWLEGQLDDVAERNPDPGAPSLHRMNRIEYANTIRDLLDLEVSVATLLPSDSTSAGFGNISDVLGSSPTLIQAYVSAAMKVSRLAVGDLSVQPAPVTYNAPRGMSQRNHVDGLPLGTQGGMLVRHNFPLDAEYEVRGRGDLTLDGMPLPGGGRGRVPIPAGPHTIGAAAVRAFEAGNMDSIFSAPGRGASGATITINGPFTPSGPGNTPARRRIFVCYPANAGEETACATRILKSLATRAFRQPLNDNDPSLGTLLEFYREGHKEAGFEAGIQRALARLLVDPRFIFRMEHTPEGVSAGAPYRLSDLEIASRLSFFLWSSIPDETLLSIAAAGRLSDPAVLEQQTRRMLADPKAKALVENFATEWMRLRELENAEPESPDFDGNLRMAFARETQLFFENIMREDRSIIDLLDADYTFVDERLARHYGIPGVKGSLFRRVTLPQDHPRRGVLGKGSVLLVTSVANRTSPVQRGQWVLENLLGAPPPKPPAGVETNLDQQADASKARSLRERMELHRTQPVCASCHNIMDPIGFTLENFDLVGKWREFDGETRIDATAEMVDGSKLDGPGSLRRALLNRSDMLVTVAAEKLLTYATGRALTAKDMPAVRKIVRASARDGYRFSSLVLGIVESMPFQMRAKDSPGAAIAGVR